MNITQEKLDEQSALLKVKIEPQDYHQKYDSALKNYRRQLQLPGFRAGKVPMGMVKSRFGKSVLADELNKVLNDSIQDYIAENKIKVLGSPIPSEAHEETGDWDNPTEFEFFYELGLAPQLDVSVSSNDRIGYYTIKVDDTMLNDHIQDIAERHGELVEQDAIDEERVVIGDLVELEENGDVKPGGIFKELRFRVQGLGDATNELLKGKKIEEIVKVDPRKLVPAKNRLATQLEIDENEIDGLHENFQFTVKEVKWMKPADINKEFYDKVFGEGKVNSEEEFRLKMTAEIANGFVRESNQLFKRDITRYLIDKYDPSLPDTFLKRWIVMTNEKPVSPDEVERDYDGYKRGLQWQLIFNEMLSTGAIEVKNDEVLERGKQMLAAQYAQYGIPAPDDEDLEESARKILAKEDQARGILDALYDEKLAAYFKSNATVQEKEVSFDEFVEMANN